MTNRTMFAPELAWTLVLAAALGGSEGSGHGKVPAGISKPAKYFSDATASSGLCVLPGCAQKFGGILLEGGALAGDFDRDGWQDLFVLGRQLSPDALFMNNGDGTFTQEATLWGVDDVYFSIGGAVGDYDADGDLDIFVTSIGDGTQMGVHRLYRNNGDRSFTDVAVQAGVNSNGTIIPSGWGACFGDYDLDGDLDLFVAAFQWFPNPSMGNRLFRNKGDGTFVDVTKQAGLYKDYHGYAPVFADMDGDLYPELLVAADFGTSKYWRNLGNGKFVDHTAASGTGKDQNGMGATVADFDEDGRLDWYVTSIYWPATGQGNMLYMNKGGHTFAEKSHPAGVFNGGWGWGTVAVDFDHDGTLDLLETNGFAGFPPKFKVWRGLGGGSFAEIQKSGLNFKAQGRGLLTLDYDNDGDRDVVVTSPDVHELRLFESRASDLGKNWLKVNFDTSSNAGLAPDGFGTRVRLSTGTQTLHRYLDGGCRYGGQSELGLHFGLGNARRVAEMEVRWADGTTTYLTDLTVNQTITVKAPK